MPTPPTALCLSGGGFRATLFHLGAIRRLNDLGVLSTLDVITSVSGGSILNGFLAKAWSNLEPKGGVFANFDELVTKPVERFCSRDLRTPLLVGKRLNPLHWPRLIGDGFSLRANFLADAYRPHLPERLADLPGPQPGTTPRFVFVATNVVTGLSWQFHTGPQARMGDFHFGYLPVGETGLAEAVAASSAFPPGFGALHLDADPAAVSRLDPWDENRPAEPRRPDQVVVHDSGKVLLTDGGVYDNLGIEPVDRRTPTGRVSEWTPDCYSLLVSNAQQLFQSRPSASQRFLPRVMRASDIVYEQVGSLRRRWLMERVKSNPGKWRGVLWMLASDPLKFHVRHPVGYGQEVRNLLSSVRTDLNAFTAGERACLQNFGYHIADAALRTFGGLTPPHATYTCPDPTFELDKAAKDALTDSHRRHLGRDVLRYFLRRAPDRVA